MWLLLDIFEQIKFSHNVLIRECTCLQLWRPVNMVIFMMFDSKFSSEDVNELENIVNIF